MKRDVGDPMAEDLTRKSKSALVGERVDQMLRRAYNSSDRLTSIFVISGIIHKEWVHCRI